MMLRDVGCEYVIIGHSERRTVFGESDDVVGRKVIASLREGLKPIVCVGETLAEREKGKTLARVKAQIKGALKDVVGGALRDVTIAYEPVWAIGTGNNATPGQAEEVHNSVRELLYEMYDSDSVKQ